MSGKLNSDHYSGVIADSVRAAHPFFRWNHPFRRHQTAPMLQKIMNEVAAERQEPPYPLGTVRKLFDGHFPEQADHQVIMAALARMAENSTWVASERIKQNMKEAESVYKKFAGKENAILLSLKPLAEVHDRSRNFERIRQAKEHRLAIIRKTLAKPSSISQNPASSWARKCDQARKALGFALREARFDSAGVERIKLPDLEARTGLKASHIGRMELGKSIFDGDTMKTLLEKGYGLVSEDNAYWHMMELHERAWNMSSRNHLQPTLGSRR